MNTNNKPNYLMVLDIKNLLFIVGCVITVLCLSTSGYASGGNPNTIDPNSVTDPNEITEPNSISSSSDWESLMTHPSHWGDSFILTCDIDLAGITLTPIGTLSEPFTGSINGNGYTIQNAQVSCAGDNYIGLIGYLGKEGIISKLGVESVSITGNKFVGGLVGCTYFGTIQECYCSGTVTGQSEIGGLIGRNSGRINSCYSTCSVSGNNLVGGLAGTNTGLASCIEASYSTGLLTCVNPDDYTGGLVGKNSGFIYSCFWDMDTSGQNGSSGGKGLFSNQMKDVSVYQNAGWFDFGWTINNGQDYPKLAWENSGGVSIPEAGPVPLNGTGTQADPYQISTAEELALLSWYSSLLDKHIVLTSNIDVSSTEVCPIGSLGAFSGVFDGAEHLIENLTIANNESNDYVGLFGIVHNATISDLGVHDVNVVGNNYVGGLIGCNLGGKVHSCYVTGEVSGESNVGGLIGYSSVNISQN